MSKASQREARERNEEESRQREQKFSLTLAEWMQTFSEYFRQEPPTQKAMVAYTVGLEDLSLAELKLGCAEALKTCEFFPKVADIREALRVARDRIGYGHSPAEPETGTPMTKQEREAIAKSISEVGKSFGTFPSRFEGQHWTPEAGWMPKSSVVKDEKPELNRVDLRPSAQWSREETEKYMLQRGFVREGATWVKQDAIRQPGED